jgi:anti-sigma regulatory factor (Ser/Thr protein kinase)
MPNDMPPASPDPTDVDSVFPAVPQSAASARRFVRASLRRAGLADARIDDAALLVSELVTNALVHARGSVRVRILCDVNAIRIEVGDADDHEEEVTMQPLSPERGSGRGLRIVDVLARRWSTRSRPDGKAVWFELERA